MVVVPVVMPLTRPPVVMVAIAGFALLQVPPGVALDKVIVEPAHTAPGPVMGVADEELPTASAHVAVAVPQVLVTV
jgi:hypothetical protein